MSETTDALVCVACNSPNSPIKKFCLQCGEKLTYECPECEIENPVVSSFCGSCGHDLRSFLEVANKFVQNAQIEASQKAVQFDFAGAIRVLVSACESPTIRLKSHANQLNELIAQYRKAKEEQKFTVTETTEKAEFYFEKGDMRQVVECLTEVPAAQRTREIEKLLEAASDHLEASKRLSKEINALIKQKNLLGALPMIKSLLEYRPNDEKLKNLVITIVSRLVTKIKHLKQCGRTKEAFQLARELKLLGHSSESDQLYEQLHQSIWLDNFLRHAQVVDAALVRALEAKVDTEPTDENKKLLTESRKRLDSVANHRSKIAAWVPVPHELAFGIPVAVSPSCNVIEGMDQIWSEGRSYLFFQVAAGLATQGLGLAALSTNLLDKKKSFFSFRSKKKVNVAWGIDFGKSSLKAIKLSIGPQEKIKLEEATALEYRKRDPQASPSELRSNMLEALLRLKSKCSLQKDDVLVCNLDQHQVLGRFISLPNTDQKALMSALEFEVKLQVPFPMEDIVWDHHFFPQDSNNNRFALVLASRKKEPQLLDEMFSANGMKLAAAQANPIALFNLHALQSKASGRPMNTAFLDIGQSSTTATIASDSRVWFRNFGVGTSHFSRALGKELLLNNEQAEKCLIDITQSESNIIKAMMSLRPAFEQLVSEIGRTLTGFSKEPNADPPLNIYCMGGGTKIPGLLTYLRNPPSELSVD